MKSASTALIKFGMLSVREAVNASDVNVPSSNARHLQLNKSIL